MEGWMRRVTQSQRGEGRGQMVCNIHLFLAFWKYGLWEGEGETRRDFRVILIKVGF
jgi:hypothetical protein